MKKLNDYENQFLNSSSNFEGINLPYLNIKIPFGKVVEIRGKELSPLYYFLECSKQVDYSLIFDVDKSVDINLIRNLNITDKILFGKESNYTSIFNNIQLTIYGDMIKIYIINTVLGVLPEDDIYNFEKSLSELVKKINNSKSFLFLINPYLTNKYDIISKYADIILVNKKRHSIKRKEERIGYEFDCHIIKNLINFKLGVTPLKLFYNKGIKND